MVSQTDRAPAHGRHIPALDGLRGIAVLIVMVLHFSILQPTEGVDGVYWRIVGGGWAGVDLFFVLSGFLITGILFDAKGSSSYFRSFFARRILRIFPLYYGFLLLLFVVWPVVRPSAAQPMEKQLWIWTYLSNVLFARVGWEGMPSHTTHLWSLAVEEQFYMVWPFIVFWASRRQLIGVCLGVFAAATLVRIGLHFTAGHGIAGYVLLPARMDALAVGALIALLFRGERGLQGIVPLQRPLAAAGALLIGGAALASAVLDPQGSYLPALGFHSQLLAYPGIALLSAAALIGAVAAAPGSATARLLGSRPLARLGRYSYGLYLIHVPIRNLLRDHAFLGGIPRVLGSQLPAQLAILALGIALSYALALASWYGFERHFLSLKRHFDYDRKGAAPAPVELGAGS